MKRNFLILLLFLIWSALSTWFYVCKIKGMCQTQVKTEKVTPPPKPEIKPKKQVAKLGPLVYKWSEVNPITNDLWSNQMKKILAGKADGKKLQITAPYYADEKNNTKFANLGLARAEEVRRKYFRDIDPKLILTRGKLISSGAVKARQTPFDGWQYIKWVINNDNVKEIDGKIMIYFPTNSTKEISNKHILDYLNDLAKEMKLHPEWDLQITGHTDSDGDESANYKLGLGRAKKIKAKLVSKGVEASRIRATSKGENQPIASNKTKEGKQKNRRVEVQIMK